jgi:hypothetical protein
MDFINHFVISLKYDVFKTMEKCLLITTYKSIIDGVVNRVPRVQSKKKKVFFSTYKSQRKIAFSTE